jgi:hypothetical protein
MGHDIPVDFLASRLCKEFLVSRRLWQELIQKKGLHFIKLTQLATITDIREWQAE